MKQFIAFFKKLIKIILKMLFNNKVDETNFTTFDNKIFRTMDNDIFIVKEVR